MAALKLNLGSGRRPRPGYVNVDKFGDPDVKHDLEVFPWPWPDDSVEEIALCHVLEHLGLDANVYFGIMKETYRVCQAHARIHIQVPHFRSDNFFNDPTHVRAVTPGGLACFSQRLNREWIAEGLSATPLGLNLGVDFELVHTIVKPSPDWYRLHPGSDADMDLLRKESALYNNLIEEFQIELRVVK